MTVEELEMVAGASGRPEMGWRRTGRPEKSWGKGWRWSPETKDDIRRRESSPKMPKTLYILLFFENYNWVFGSTQPMPEG